LEKLRLTLEKISQWSRSIYPPALVNCGGF
jgi:hypothetical protein